MRSTIKEHTHTMPSGRKVRIVIDTAPDEGVGFSDACPENALEEISRDERRRIEAYDEDMQAAASHIVRTLDAAGISWIGVETADFTLTENGRYQHTAAPFHEYDVDEDFSDVALYQDDRGKDYIIHGDCPDYVRRVLDGDIAFNTVRVRVWDSASDEPWEVAGEANLGMVETEAIREHIPGIAHEALRAAGIDSDTTTTTVSEIM